MSLLTKPRNPVPIHFDLTVQLTEAEDKICTLFHQCTVQLKTDKGIDTTCRIAGGWVRDKLLGLQSNDIDVALSNMMGVAFADYFSAFAHSKGIETGKISTVKLNPHQSKHLETAKFALFGLELDLVNLRSEEYTDDSRIPTGVSFGTPLQDAVRRDMTINSLFYNVHSREVEDQTGKGLDDLRTGSIRTPLPPRQTFLDDPLRVIRCLRFASRLGFSLSTQLSEAIHDSEIQTALIQKVTRERVGEELFKMLTGPDPLHSIQLIHRHGVFKAIFGTLPEETQCQLSSPVEDISSSLAAVAILKQLLDPYPSTVDHLPTLHPSLLHAVKEDPTCITRLYLGSALMPYKNMTLRQKKKDISLVELSIRESLKIGTKSHLADGVPAMFEAHKMIGLPKLDAERFTQPSERVALGLLLREKTVHNVSTGTHWSSSILFSLVYELLPCYNLQEDLLNVAEATKVINTFNTFVSRIEELGLSGISEAKPILDGHTVIKILQVQKPGSWTGKVMSDVMTWQLDNPEGTKEDCSIWLKRKLDAGEIDTGTSEPVTKRPRVE